MNGLQLIVDKGYLFFLDQFKSNDHNVKETISLLERKINGDDPTKKEWIANANAYAYANANAIANAYANAIANAYAISYATANHIIDLLGDDLIAIPNLDKLVLTEIEKEGNSLNMSLWHSCETTHCRAGWEVVITEQGKELEKYFGTWMAATIIHKKSTGVTVDYYATKDKVMSDLRAG